MMAITIAYRNPKLIADDVLPRVPVGTQEFKYPTYTKADSFTVPDTKVGRKSKPNEVEFSATETTAKCDDYALDDPVPQEDIDNAEAVSRMTGKSYDPLGRANEGVTDLIMLAREIRSAGLVFTAANYPAGNKATLSGTTQWSDYVNSDPASAIMTALDALIFRPNIMVLGRAVYTKLIMHPKIVAAIFGNNQSSGIVARQQLATLFELDQILVGEGWVNTAKKGQTPTISRVWGKHCSLLYRDLRADTRGGTSFGYTAQWGNRIAGAMPDATIGMRGGQRVRVGESVKELITASDLGYMFENAVA
jgi:hypothetical protein